MARSPVPWDVLAALYSIVFVTALGVALVVAWGPLDVILGPAVWAVLLGFLVVFIGLGYGLSGRNAAIATMALTIGAMVVGGQVARVLDFETKAMGFPLADATLASWDAWLGLNWRGYYDWQAQHGEISFVLEWLYRPTQLFVAATVVLLTVRGRHRDAATFGVAIASALVICVVIGGFFPAVGPYGYFGIPDHGIAPWAALLPDIVGGRVTVAYLAKLPALTTFPSYHSAVAILAALACRRAGRVGIALSVVNLVWLAGVPVWGDHYFVDVIAGVLIGALCHFALFRWLGVERISARVAAAAKPAMVAVPVEEVLQQGGQPPHS